MRQSVGRTAGHDGHKQRGTHHRRQHLVQSAVPSEDDDTVYIRAVFPDHVGRRARTAGGVWNDRPAPLGEQPADCGQLVQADAVASGGVVNEQPGASGGGPGHGGRAGRIVPVAFGGQGLGHGILS